jgi:hypothetical protein
MEDGNDGKQTKKRTGKTDIRAIVHGNKTNNQKVIL